MDGPRPNVKAQKQNGEGRLDEPVDRKIAFAGHVLPFLVWVAFILVFQCAESIGRPFPRSWAAPAYAVKSALCAILLLGFRPWRFYKGVPLGKSAVLTGLLGGVLVTALWIFPETSWAFRHFQGGAIAYNEWAILPPGAFPSYFVPETFPALPAGHPSLAYSPAEAGWFLTMAKLVGSAFVIATAEEYFFRGFLYRWLRKGRFWEIPVSVYDAATFWGVVLVFGMEHDRWLAGMIAGAVYGWIVLKTGRILPAVIAHMTTNLLLGLYVIFFARYGFW